MFNPADLVITPEHDLALTQPFEGEPGVVETFNTWLYDGTRNIGFNIHPYATGGRMDCATTVFLPDGRITRANFGSPGPFTDPARPSSSFVKLRCVEPGARWEVEIVDQPVFLTSDDGQAAGTVPDETPTATISLKAVVETVSPAWVNGALLPESRETIKAVASWMGNRLNDGFDPRAFRYDHLAEGEGEVVFEGRRLAFSGVGLRGHVRGVRRMPGMLGHCWAEGYSPDRKRGFGTQHFLREGGGYVHSEGMLWEGGKLHPARIICAPHLDRDPGRKDFVFELACDELGLVRILMHDVRAFWRQMQGWGSQTPPRHGCDPTAPMLMKQGLARFTWEDDGTVGYGLVERSG